MHQALAPPTRTVMATAVTVTILCLPVPTVQEDLHADCHLIWNTWALPRPAPAPFSLVWLSYVLLHHQTVPFVSGEDVKDV